MQISNAIGEILALQPEYSQANTDSMSLRGTLIRREMPEALRPFRDELASSTSIALNDLIIEGRDGTGRKSEIPWVRIASRKNSPRATEGWYVVWLFRRDGAGVYLALAHGSTTFQDGALVPRPPKELADRMTWARARLKDELADEDRLTQTVDLATQAKLALAYESSCVAAYYYPFTNIPSDEQLIVDLLALTTLLGRIYSADSMGQVPYSESPDLHDALAAADAIARPQFAKGQGFRISFEERKAVELRAMELAETYLLSKGFSVKDVSGEGSFDLLATKNNEAIKVEVKGTTGSLGAVFLTRNEVELHKNSYPLNALIVVHDINLDHGTHGTQATGGVLLVWAPWRLDDARLQAITYSYSLV